jgi:ligand-binding sensor domain-containing protein
LDNELIQRSNSCLSGWLTMLMAPALSVVCVAQPSPARSAKLAAVASAQEQRPEIGSPMLETHSYKEYNDQGQIWTILQDQRGVMYFGVSSSNIIEYDGVTWRKIETAGTATRSMAMDSTGRIWVGSTADIGYLAPDPAGTLRYVSLNDKIPENERKFTSVWQTLVTPQGVFYRAYEELFRWDGKSMHTWKAEGKQRFQALQAINGHIYTAQNGIGLEEIAGDELRPLPGGDAYKDSLKLFFYPYDDKRWIVSEGGGLLSFYDGEKSTPFKTPADDVLKEKFLYTLMPLADGGFCVTTTRGGVAILEHDGRLRQIIDKAEGLLDSSGYSAYMDHDGALWVGST